MIFCSDDDLIALLKEREQLPDLIGTGRHAGIYRIGETTRVLKVFGGSDYIWDEWIRQWQTFEAIGDRSGHPLVVPTEWFSFVDSAGRARGCFVMPHVNGPTIDVVASDVIVSEKRLKDFGASVASLHMMLGEVSNSPKFWRTDLYQELHAVRTQVLQSCSQDDELVIGQTLNRIDGIGYVIPPRIIHGDLNPGNVLVESVSDRYWFIDPRIITGNPGYDFMTIAKHAAKLDPRNIRPLA